MCIKSQKVAKLSHYFVVTCYSNAQNTTVIYKMFSMSLTLNTHSGSHRYNISNTEPKSHSLSLTVMPFAEAYLCKKTCVHYAVYNKKSQLSLKTRATLAKRLHGLCKSSEVVSCIASLPIDSLPMISY